jgi:hypothetical protein
VDPSFTDLGGPVWTALPDTVADRTLATFTLSFL